MKIIEKVLKNKLASFGFNVENFSTQINQIDLAIIENQISLESDADKYITTKIFKEPTVEVPRTLVNYSKYYIQNLVMAGNVNFSTLTTSIGTIFPVVDYDVTQNLCIISTTVNLTVEVLIYQPDNNIKMQYAYQTYESIVANERNDIAQEYYEAFVENGRLPESKVKSVMGLLFAEHIIDEMTLTDSNPKIKMYDNPDLYAENITDYKIKYINRKTNRIEIALRPVYIKRLGYNVIAGYVNNDPYIKIEKMPRCADFPLKAISCYWISNPNTKKEEVAVYIATKDFNNASTYREYKENDDNIYESISSNLQMQFISQLNRKIDKGFIKSVLKRLNPELINPSMAIIRDSMENPSDQIEPLKYRFKATDDATEFERKLYISIEDNIGKRYKYKLPENVLDDLTRIGNKLEYTKEDGEIVRKQSVADFNVNSSTAIVRRKTLVDYSCISGLLGYIYDDMEYLGTDMLPVPSIEIEFYFPPVVRKEVSMFNGTNFSTDIASLSSYNKFNSIDDNNANSSMPGTTYATVKYVNSKGEILKENVINNLYAGSSYVPEIIPIINDSEGKEWVCANTQFPSTIINMLPEYNVIEVKYKEKYSKVYITFLGRDGKKIGNDIIETIQTGSTYDINDKNHYTDEQGNDWTLIGARPQKLVVKDEGDNNKLILIYDFEKEPVTINYLNSNGEKIIESQVSDQKTGKIFSIDVEKILIDSNGLGWIYNGKNPIEHMVVADEDNTVNVQYEEYKLPVVVKYQDKDGISVLNDKVEYIQVGVPYIPEYDKVVNDIKLRVWKYKEGDTKDFITSKDERKNTIKIIYEPVLASVSIRMVNESGNNIINPVIQQCQIGEEFSSIYMNEIEDNYNRIWTKMEEPESLVVSKNEVENNIVIKYKPLIGDITVYFYDDERNELIPSRQYNSQVGTLFKPEIIESLISSDGRKWFLSNDKVEEITVRRNNEENIVSIYYEKELTDILLEFYDAYGKKLRDPLTVKGQIGSVYNPKPYDVIEDFDNFKWMIEGTEPKKLVVKANDNKFRLIYGELKAIVVVKYVNVKTNESVMDDVIAKVKLGGIYIPNILERVYDKNKFLWKFIGDKNLSIVVKENEQENIIVLQYDEVLSNVHVKYRDLHNNTLRDDINYELQVGRPIDDKKLGEFIDSNGMGWKLDSSKSSSLNAEEGENEVINLYNPLKVDVKVRYVNENDDEISISREDKIQVGRTYEIEYDERVISKDNLLWQYKEGVNGSIRVDKNGNVINVIYSPVLANVTEKISTNSNEKILDDIVNEHQVGSVIKFEPDSIIADEEEKRWNFVRVDRGQITVQEDSTKNIVTEFYEERNSEITVSIYDEEDVEIYGPKKFYGQVGSKYFADIPRTIIASKTKLGWELPSDVDYSIVVNEDSSKNIVSVKYGKYLVKVIERRISPESEIVVPDVEKQLQVGTTFAPTIEKELIDLEGKEWIFGKKREKGLLFDDKGPNENPTLIVSENEDKNILLLKYNPSMTKVTVKYQNNLGQIISQAEEFEAQIGSKYVPNIKEIIKDSKKNRWMFNPNSKTEIIVDKDPSKNIIMLSYEEEKAPVIYEFQDEYKNKLKAPKKVLAQIGSIYRPEIDNVIEDEEGKVWEYKESSTDSLEIKDSGQENVIEVTYIPLLVDVELNMKNRKGDLINKSTEKAQLGSKYRPNIEEKIFDDKSMMFKFVKCEPEELVIKETPIGSTEKLNVFEMEYEQVYSNITIVYQDVNGNKLKDDEIIQLQVGTKFTPKTVQYVTDKKGIQWENITKTVDTIRVMENPNDNIIKMTYEVASAEVVVRYRDLTGNTVKESDRFQENIGVEFIPKFEEIISDSKNRKWSFVSSDPVKLTVGSINNIINLTYQEKKVPVTIKYQTVDGKKLRADVVENVQEGIQYIPNKKYAIIYDENDIWRYLEFRPSSLLVTDNESENVIIQVYDNNVIESEDKNKLENPFANTLEDNIDNSTVEIKEENVKEDSIDNNNTTNNSEEDKPNICFTDENLIKLSKSILVEDNEVKPIIELNEINKKIIMELNLFKNSFDLNKQEIVLHSIDEYMLQEKEIIKNNFTNMFLEDKTGKKFLRILEAIVSFDTEYQKIQERKVVLLTDYFVNSDVTNMEQALYICDRGKNNKRLEILRNTINKGNGNTLEIQKLFIELIYEKAMLNNYYKTRTQSKDEYFNDSNERATVGQEVAVIVDKTLIKQAFNLIQKNVLNFAQQNEMQAIMQLLSTQQLQTIEKMISEIKDGKLRKEITKRFKEFQ